MVRNVLATKVASDRASMVIDVVDFVSNLDTQIKNC